jgi:hypothetical protein
MAQADADHVFAAIEEHKRLRAIAYYSGVDEGSEHEAACDAEESALQALGDREPKTVAAPRRFSTIWQRSRAASPIWVRRF